MTYGVFELNGPTTAALGIGAMMLLIIATAAYALGWWLVGMLLQVGAALPFMVLITTWFTELSSQDWDDMGPLPVVAALILLVAGTAVPPYVGEHVELG